MSTPSPNTPAKNFILRVPPDDNRERLTCSDCGWINYENPRIIVTAIVRRDHELMLCRRAIRPRYGFWTFPGGFMEIGESPEDGARREVFEEAGAEVEIRELMGIYSVPRLGQVHLVYLADMAAAHYAAGVESLDVQFFDSATASFPWDELAFPVNHWALRDFASLKDGSVGQPFTARPEDLRQRMSSVDIHPDFAPLDAT